MSSFDTFQCDGVALPIELKDKMATMKSRDSREDDILLVAYPKSGNHWVWEILNMIVAGKVEYAEHWVNFTMLEMRSEQQLQELPSPRVLTAHIHPRMLPESVWSRKVKIIHVQRDPKDAMVSYYSQMISQTNVWQEGMADTPHFTGTWEEYFEAFTAGKVPFGSWFDFANEWQNSSEYYPDNPVFTVYFEELKKDCPKQVKKMAEFLGRPLAESLYQEISDACSFKKLKEISETKKNQQFHVKWKGGSTGYFRKGVVGDWKSKFTVAQNERFDQLYEEKLGRKYQSSKLAS